MVLAACSTAPATRTEITPGATYFEGVFTLSTVSYAHAAATTDAVRFAADGTFESGRWDAAARHFAPDERRNDFVTRWDFTPDTHSFRFLLDGAEESVTFVIDAADRWKTVYIDPDERVDVHYVRR